jgi:chromosomal replication initiator protein
VDVLAIDDVHFLAKRDRTQEEFFHTFNALHQAKKQIILSSDAPPEEIPDLEDRLVSRFKWGLVSHIGPPCYETRIAILKNKARMRGFELGDDVASHIAAKIDSNIRELEGAIVKLQVLASVDKRSIDLELAMAALGTDSGPARADRQVQIQSIIEVVTNYYTVKLTDLQSKRRHRSVAIPRQVCMFLCRRHTRYSLEEIGGYFGGRDHTTVMHAVKTIESRSETDPEFAQVLRRLDEHLRMPVVS